MEIKNIPPILRVFSNADKSIRDEIKHHKSEIMKLEGCVGEFYNSCIAECRITYIEEMNKLYDRIYSTNSCSNLSNLPPEYSRHEDLCNATSVLTYEFLGEMKRKQEKDCESDCYNKVKRKVSNSIGF